MQVTCSLGVPSKCASEQSPTPGAQILLQIQWRCCWPVDERIPHPKAPFSKWVSIDMKEFILFWKENSSVNL